MKILILPDGSAIEAQYVKAITWGPSSPGAYGHKAFLRVYGYKSNDGIGFLGRSSGLEQIHACRMEGDEEARNACDELVKAWASPDTVEA